MRCTILAQVVLFTFIPDFIAAEPVPGRQVEMVLKLGGRDVQYLLYLPKEYAAQATNRWPMMLFLHGRGESQGPPPVVAKWEPPRRAALNEHFPFLLVSPQCPANESWPQPNQQKLLLGLPDHVVTNYHVDPDRIYLTGLSMGGYGTWRLAADFPARFAAVVPVCGAGQPEAAVKMKTLPIWVFHGTEGKAVPLKASETMVEALKKAGSTKVRFTTLEFIGHNSWEAAYATPELYQWLAQQRASQNGSR